MKRLAVATFGVLAAACAVSATYGESINMFPVSTLQDLLGSNPIEVTGRMVTNLSNGNMQTEAYSQAFSGNGKYAYLYQLNNTGRVGINSPVELFTVWPFPEPALPEGTGYLTGAVPSGFLGGGQSPENTGFDTHLEGGAQFSFYYTQRFGMAIDPGEPSKVMYILSDYGPGPGVSGSAIDGSAATGPVVGAVPEPGTAVLVVAAGFAMVICVWRGRAPRNCPHGARP